MASVMRLLIEEEVDQEQVERRGESYLEACIVNGAA